jgi:hypothetical protein
MLTALMSAAMAAATPQVVTVPAEPVAQPQAPAEQMSEDSPEEIAADSQRDLKDSRFYNKPGATRADYDAAWQECRLIARGSRTPSGGYTYVYNPAIISPLAAGAGGAIGGFLGAMIVEGQARRANRRQCLLIHGWRLVEPPPAERARIAAMPDAERDAFFNTIVGADTLNGYEISQWDNSFAAPHIAPESEQ